MERIFKTKCYDLSKLNEQELQEYKKKFTKGWSKIAKCHFETLSKSSILKYYEDVQGWCWTCRSNEETVIL